MKITKNCWEKKQKDNYRKLSEEKKNMKREYGRNRYNNMSEEKKQKLKEYQKNCREANMSKKSWILVKQYINSFLILWVE